MCTQTCHDELNSDWRRFEDATLPGFIQQAGGYVWESRNCRRCRSSLPHPRDLARHGVAVRWTRIGQ